MSQQDGEIMKYFLLIALSFNLLAMTPKEIESKGVLHYETVIHGEVPYKFLITKNQGMAKLSVYNENEKLILTRERALALEGFKKLKIKSLISDNSKYLITFWKKGAHGTTVEVFDLSKKGSKPIKIINSYLSIDYQETLDSFSVVYDKKLKGGDLSPIKHKVIFSANGQISEHKL